MSLKKSSEALSVSNALKDDTITKSFFAIDVMFFDRHLEKMYLGKDLYKLMKQNIHLLRELGIGLLGLNWNWREIEPYAPRKGLHSYNWTRLDKIMALLHDNGIRVKLQIFPSTMWASQIPTKALNRAGPIKKEHMNNWKEFIQSLVERYDGDGVNDAFKMNLPVLKILNVSGEVEAGNNWSKLGGTINEYDQFLSQTTNWVKEVSQSVLVARGGVNFGGRFDRISNDQELEEMLASARKKRKDRRVLRFFLKSIQNEDTYDLFALQLNDHWSGIKPQVKWIRQQFEYVGYSKPLLANHTRSTLVDPILESTFLDPQNNGFKRASAIFYHNQASHTIKKLTLGLACGLSHMMIATIFDGGFSGSPRIKKLKVTRSMSWIFAGLLNGEAIADKRNILPVSKPVYYSYKLFIRKIAGSNIEVETLDLGENVYAYRFGNNSKPIVVAWYEDVKASTKYPDKQSKKIHFPVSSYRVRVTHIITEIGQTEPKIEIVRAKDEKINLLLTDTPIFIEQF
jgi:hypothetical protein